jgi:hypothetical protein
MGFTYAVNPHTGRECLACDFCNAYRGDEKGTKWVRKIPCPYGYCQAWATCDKCYAEGRHKVSSCGAEPTKNHEGCKKAHEEFEREHRARE